ncbi:MAG: diguanylate cyclase [Methylococcaceae bacterium]|nr:diguanylate cyclase [Methylococcaceae bacterium]
MSDIETIKILLIEDEPSDAELVQINLRSTKVINFNVNWVESLHDAKKQISNHSFDLLLLDLSLPDSFGLDTLKNTQAFSGETPIIVLTGQDDTEFALDVLKTGAADYLVKGDFSQDTLIRTIRYTLHRTEMESRNALLIAALKATANGIFITDVDAAIKWANPAFTKLTGYTLEDVIGQKPAELVKSGLQDQAYYQQMWDTLRSGKPWRGEIINKHKSGHLYHEELNISPVLNKAGTIEHFVGVKEDISKRKQMEKELQKLANTDSLTGLFNRRVFLERLQEETKRLNRLEQHSAALLMLDLDFFKQVNDTYGHATGDQVLRAFAEIFTVTLRSIDHAARLGGEEFAVLLPITDEAGALVIAERLRLKAANIAIENPKGTVHITVSVGIAVLSKNDKDYEDVLHRADAALYQAKAQGRNQSCCFVLTEEIS